MHESPVLLKLMLSVYAMVSGSASSASSACVLPFDAHNHVHLGPTPPSISLSHLSGMAVMSTHPRDYNIVKGIAENPNHQDKMIIPCFGCHPWFLHELSQDDWKIEEEDVSPLPLWVRHLESLVATDPLIAVGEIGLDNFHFDPTTKELTSDMDTQIRALEYQLDIATKYRRPVSLHCVRAIGKLMEALTETQKRHGTLPPRIYFHAFGGKAATIRQLIKTLETKKAKTKVYFGFAPMVNFESKKTLEVIQAVGLERIVLETDHEDANRVSSSMKLGLEVIARAFEISQDELIQQTNLNVRDLYGTCWPTTSVDGDCGDETEVKSMI